MATQSAASLPAEHETRFNPGDLQFRRSPIDTEGLAISALSNNSRHILHSNQPPPDITLRRLVASRAHVWTERNGDEFFGLHLVHSSDELGNVLVACYSVSLDGQGVKVDGIKPHAYLCDILVRNGITGSTGIVPLIVAHFHQDAQAWACAAEEVRAVGLYVSKPALVNEMPNLGFTLSARKVKTRFHGESTFFTKKFGPGLG